VTGSEVNLHPEGRPRSTNIRLLCALRNSALLLMGRWPLSPAPTHAHQLAIHFTVTWLQGTLCIYKCVHYYASLHILYDGFSKTQIMHFLQKDREREKVTAEKNKEW